MLLTELLQQQAAKIGLQDNAELVSVLAKVGTIEIPDELANQFHTGLMSLEGAKNNAQLLNHFKPTVLNAVDDQFKIFAEKYGISDEMAQEKSTYKKAAILEAALARKIAEAEAKIGASDSKAEINKLNKQLSDLQGQLAQAHDAHKAKISELEKKHSEEQLNFLVDFELGNKNFANKAIDKKVSILTAKTLMQEDLKAKGAVIINENGVLKLKQAENPTMDFVDAGYKPISFKDYTDQVLASSHLLEVSGKTIKAPVVPAAPSQVQFDTTAFTNAINGAQITK
jgi:hypothetical protein